MTKYFRYSPKVVVLLLPMVLIGCGPSRDDLNAQLDDAYDEGWYEALDCVKKKGGSADEASDECKERGW